MSVYKLERCRTCNYKKRTLKISKNILPCPSCNSDTLYYSKNFYFAYYLQGQKHEKSAGPDKKRAQEAEWKMKLSIVEGKAYTPISWKSSVEELERTYRTLSPKTVEMYRNCVVNLSTVFGLMKLSGITERHLELFKSAHLQKGLSASSFNQHRSTLKRIFALSSVDWRFKKSVFTAEKETIKTRFLSQEEQCRLLKACDGKGYLHTIIMVGLDTGLRKEALLSLQFRDIDFKSNIITKIGKGGKVSKVPMTNRLHEHLVQHRIKVGLRSPYLFPSPTNPDSPVRDIRKTLAAACREANLNDVTLHVLRKSFASHLVMATRDITLTQQLLGHSSIEVTRKHYAHLMDSHIKDGIEQFEKATGGSYA